MNGVTVNADADVMERTSNSYLFAQVPEGSDSTPLPYFAAEMTPTSWGRYWRTLKPLRLSQLRYLIQHRTLGRNRLNRWADAEVSVADYKIPQAMSEWEPHIARQIIELGDVRFVRDKQDAEIDLPWWRCEIGRREIFNASYCEFLNVDLTGVMDRDLLRKSVQLALSWCNQNPSGHEMGWHPFFLSLRIVNWLKYLMRNSAAAEKLGEGAHLQRVMSSLRIQVLSLESRLERELLANHLLKNAKALIFAGSWLNAPESPRWRKLGERLLREQISEQILPDGGHIERSPMYHTWILDHMIDIRNLFLSRPPDDARCARDVADCIDRMARYLAQITHPDGEIPLLNDSQLGVTRPTAQVLAESGLAPNEPNVSETELRVLNDSGYGVLRDRSSNSFLIFDCGPLGPEYQPGHGHCDVLTYELSLQGQRAIVDTGVSSYEPSPERHYERSTAAHNTVRVDGQEQAEIWASFRVGRRPSVSRIQSGSFNEGQFVQGEHFGYRHLGISHSRAIVHQSAESWIIIDRLRGNGRHKLESFIHFHPSIRLGPVDASLGAGDDGLIPRASFTIGGVEYVLYMSGQGTVLQTEAWYSPGFAIRQPQAVIHWMNEDELPVTMLYAITRKDAPPNILASLTDPAGVRINNNLIKL